MLVNSIEMLKKARKGAYAIPAINTQGGNYDIIRAICLAAEEMRSPIILAHYIATGAYAGDDWFYEVSKWLANKVSVPVVIHLDHGDSVEVCKKCLDIGFTSIMYDGSSFSIEENAKITNQVIAMSHKLSVPVEAEVGQLVRLDAAGKQTENTNTVKVEDVKKFLSLCTPDSLAIGIGNAHGYYTEKPNIRLDILEEVAKFTDIPLVLHGCTGMENSVVTDAIRLGVAKINFGTQIRYQYVDFLKAAIDTMNHQGHSWKIMQKASNDLKDEVKKIIELSGSEGKA